MSDFTDELREQIGQCREVYSGTGLFSLFQLAETAADKIDELITDAAQRESLEEVKARVNLPEDQFNNVVELLFQGFSIFFNGSEPIMFDGSGQRRNPSAEYEEDMFGRAIIVEKWKPKNGETYWYWFHDGYEWWVANTLWNDDNIDEARWSKGNCFEWESEADADLAKLEEKL